jgi:hypothetical protein
MDGFLLILIICGALLEILILYIIIHRAVRRAILDANAEIGKRRAEAREVRRKETAEAERKARIYTRVTQD